MKSRAQLAALLVVLTGVALTAGQTPAATPQNAAADVQAAGRLRRSGRRRHGRAGQHRPRSEERRLPGAGRRQAARRSRTFSLVDIPIERSDRPLFSPRPIEPDVKTNERPFDGRVYVMVIDDLHTRLRPIAARESRGEAVHRAPPRRERSDGGRAHGRTDRRQPGVHAQQAAAAGGRRQDAWAPSSTRPPPTRPPSSCRDAATCGSSGDPLNDPDDAERAFNAQQHARHAQERRGMVRVGPRPPEVDSLRERGHRLRHPRHDSVDRLEPLRRVDGARRDARRHRRRDAIERRDLRHRPARADRSRRRVDRDPVVPRRHLARHRPGLAAATSSACRRTACACSPTKPAASPLVNATTSPPPSSGSSRTTARTTCSRTTRPMPRPGRYHRIEVQVTRPNVMVRARQGYVDARRRPTRRRRTSRPSRRRRS